MKGSLEMLLASLKSCCRTRDLKVGNKVHADILAIGGETNTHVANTLIDMYGRCGDMRNARQVFDRMLFRDVVSWTSLLMGYAENGEGELALHLYACMHIEECPPNAVTFVAALKACINLTISKQDGNSSADDNLVKMVYLKMGRTIHFQASKSGCSSQIFVGSTLIHMYAKCGCITHAQAVFDGMPHRNVVTWTTMMLGYSENGEGEMALQLFSRMKSEQCVPDARTFVAALKACSSLAEIEEAELVDGRLMKVRCLHKGMTIHFEATKRGFDSQIFVANTLIDMYAKCRSMDNAHRVFDRIMCHNVVSWNILILGYVENGRSETALRFYTCMSCEANNITFTAALKACASLAESDVDAKLCCLRKGMVIHCLAAEAGFDSHIFVSSSLIDMYAKCGSMENASNVFNRMSFRTVASWTAMMLGYVESGEGELALQLFRQMQSEGCAPNARTFVAALRACANLAAKGLPVDELIQTIHSRIVLCSLDSDIFVANTLIGLYSNSSRMGCARRVFDMMQHRDVVSWNALLLGYAENGEGELSLHLFAHMRCKRNAITFSAALKACASLTALDRGKAIHAEACRLGLDTDITLANCLVGFYGKCGSMVDAKHVFDSITSQNLVAWNSLIAGYSRQGDTKQVIDMFEKMQKQRVKANGVTFLSILKACSHGGQIEEGMKYFEDMSSKYGINPSIEHFTCMIDIFGRANKLNDAMNIINTMPFKPNIVAWTTLLSACRTWANVVVGRIAFENVVRLDDQKAVPYALMASIYAEAAMGHIPTKSSQKI